MNKEAAAPEAPGEAAFVVSGVRESVVAIAGSGGRSKWR
jgi:hypothetical protein